LFAQFLREKLRRMDAFVHVLQSSPGSDQYVVMLASVQTAGGPMKPNYIGGLESVSRFLREIGMPAVHVREVERDLEKTSSASVRTSLPRTIPATEFYRLRFRVVSSSDNFVRVDAIGTPISGGKERSALFNLDELISALEAKLGLPPPQIAAIRRSLLSGSLTELGGVTGAPYAVSEERLAELGMMESE
jgi:hypothetical protein